MCIIDEQAIISALDSCNYIYKKKVNEYTFYLTILGPDNVCMHVHRSIAQTKLNVTAILYYVLHSMASNVCIIFSWFAVAKTIRGIIFVVAYPAWSIYILVAGFVVLNGFDSELQNHKIIWCHENYPL